MWHRIVTPMAVCLWVALATTANAQTALGHPSQSIAITTALTRGDRIDASASPRPFGGFGIAGGLDYRFEGPRWTFATSLEGAHADYRPHDDLTGSERATSARVTTSLVRQVAGGPARSLGVGLSLDTWGDVLQHHYADPSATVSSFVTVFSTLGPAAQWREALGGGTASLTATVPFAGLVHQPYADSRHERGPAIVHVIGPAEMHGAELAARYETSARARAGVVAEYRFRGFDYTGGWQVRSFTNTTSLGVVLRFGARR